MGIAHLDEIQKRRNVRGQMAGTWSNLGRAAGSSRGGASRIELAPGEQPTPPHVHGEAEEISYVLAGSGLTLLDDDAYEIRAGDCIVYRNLHEEHTILGGDDGLDVIVFGAREDLPAGELPRGRSMWSSTGYIEVQEGHPWDREPELVWPEPKQERPSVIVATSDVEPEVRDGRRRRDLGRAGGSRWTGLKHLELDPGTLSGPPHCHSAEEEIFVVLEGEGTLELTGKAGSEEHPIRQGSVVARPTGHRGRSCVQGGRAGPDPDRLGHTRAERHLLVSPLSEDLLERRRRRRPDRAGGVLGRRGSQVNPIGSAGWTIEEGQSV